MSGVPARLAALLPIVFLMTTAARAEQAPPELALRAAAESLPLILARSDGVLSGKLVLENRGKTAVDVRVLPRGQDQAWPRLPATVESGFADGSRGRLEAGQSKEIVVRWTPGAEPRPRELYGHVVVETSSGQTLAAGFHADAAPEVVPFERRALSLLLLLPLIGLLLLAGARLWRGRAVRHLWLITAMVGMAQLAIALAVHAGFDVGLSRYDGNEGFQFVERSVLLRGLGVEYALGVDGLSVGLVAFSTFALLAAALLGSRNFANGERHWALVLVLDLGVVGALVAIDIALALAFWGLALVALTAIIGGSEVNDAPRIARRFAVSMGIAYALVLASCALVASTAGPALLVDGTSVPRVFSIPELTHADLIRSGKMIAEIPAIKLICVGLFLGLLVLTGIAPLNAWLSGTIARVPAPTALLVSIAVSGVAAYLLLRIGYGVLPQGIAWAAPALGGVGALSVVWGAFTSVRHDDLRRIVASVCAVNLGAGLVAVSSLTAIGIQGAVVAIQNQLLSSALVLGLAADLQARFGSCDARLARAMVHACPVLAIVVAAACLNQLGAPGSYAFVPRTLAIVGAIPLQPLAVLVVFLGLMVLTLSQLRLAKRLLEQPAGKEAAAPAGRDFGARERSILALAAFGVTLFGFWPRPAISAIGTGALDHAARVNAPGPLQIVEGPGNQPAYGLARALLRSPQGTPAQSRLSDSRTRPLFAVCAQAKP